MHSITMWILFLAALLPSSAWAKNPDVLTFAVPQFPPYTYEENGQWHGKGYKLAIAALEKAGIKYQIRPVANYAQAFEQLNRNLVDGFFLASKNDARDKIAVFSAPVMINKWNWYVSPHIIESPLSETFIQKYRIASHFKTNTHQWLVKHNYQVEPVIELANIPIMLDKGRIDAVMLAQWVFEDAADKAGVSKDKFRVYLHSSRDFGFYVSKRVIKKHPRLLLTLNSAILLVRE
ncbi:substrate-binding periplasmic protein [Catenovulum agarivorans]|uniref:substrate-binding periplasmic protein n=1 Tax=Catenovulum agarivorans TaxID=1172192 RepID=UPI0012FA7C67|nr:transporter substrate-binding domain-containing protein [Catenovulum agarivorans]